MKTIPRMTGGALAVLLFALQAQGQDLADVFDRVHTSVVTIKAIAKARGGGPAKRPPETRVGSGVLVSKEGAILTAAHVVDLADSLEVEFPDRTTVPAKIVSVERGPDLALIQTKVGPPRNATIATLSGTRTRRVSVIVSFLSERRSTSVTH